MIIISVLVSASHSRGIRDQVRLIASGSVQLGFVVLVSSVLYTLLSFVLYVHVLTMKRPDVTRMKACVTRMRKYGFD